MEKAIIKFFEKKNSFFFILSILFLSSFHLINSSFKPLSFNDISINQSEGPNQNCLLITENNTLYDLYDLSKLETKTINPSKNIKEYGIVTINYTICKNVYESYSVIGIGSENNITSLAGNVHGEEDSKNKILPEKNEKETVTLYLPKGDICYINKSENYRFKIILACNQSVEFEKKDLYLSDECNFTLEADSKYACGKENHYFSVDEGLRIIIGIVLCILGNLLGILGYYYLIVAYLLSCIIVFPILIRFVLKIFFAMTDGIVLYVLMGVGFILGAIIAIILLKKHKFIKVYMAIIGGITGFLIGIFFCDILMTFIQTPYQYIIRSAITIIFIIIGIVLGIFFARKVCIFGTSILGAYAFMKGISFFLANKIEYIDEGKIYDYSRTGNFEQIEELLMSKSKYFLIYPILWIIFTIAYLIAQHKINPKVNDCEDYKELEGKFNSIFGGVVIETASSSELTEGTERIMEDL